MKINNILVVGFFTLGTPYQELANRLLIPSCKKFNLPYYIEAIENSGSWMKNVAQKPKVILNAMEKYPSMNIISLDVDAEFLQFPQLFLEIPEEYDLSLHYLNWNEWYKNGSDVKELLSGTIFLRNNDKVKKLVNDWYDLALKFNIWEQKCLAEIIDNNKEVNIYPLPLSYIYIKTMPDGKEPLVKIDKPIILHYQASRVAKKLIRNNIPKSTV